MHERNHHRSRAPGLSAAMLLAVRGHQVTVLERDPARPPARGEQAWTSWERPGVSRLRLPHLMMPRGRILLETELPEVVAGLETAGALRHNMIAAAAILPGGGGRQDGDARYDTLGARRPLLESVLAAAADRTAGVTVRRGVAVTRLLPGQACLPGVPHVTGVQTGDGEVLKADLVVDATGRKSQIFKLLAELGPVQDTEDRAGAGFVSSGPARRRDLVADGKPVVTGLLAIGDAWASTNPTFGQGLAMGLLQATLLRDALDTVSTADPVKLTLVFSEYLVAGAAPFYEGLRGWDHHRIAEIDAHIKGERRVGMRLEVADVQRGRLRAAQPHA
ncbi:2-polyprenyl-6-methoxyphenol hydroxylase-like FAD-dependent oxidoreductase [Thermocatellispora tengchongensis]|uniref:2-polyprenyl-6-methoxyphenol hydroxylase-like FAD-dependent oxidoreductase n=1 Tax=Thermocatellispora tengchongensis TaxID=1073253 RepID=A0A840PJ88_9ACTN|nr:tryptophan 7-halogenase [Thermocatellispora tengchongensis]MBB5136135.1 2-polyprenyl-6-methoxyphenol hydroxylase-like FAD-dependent oxidoreductase [Thermocatellispora tengchongensis]